MTGLAHLDGPAATRIRGGIDLALVLSMLARGTAAERRGPDDDDGDDDEDAAAALVLAELGSMTVLDAARAVVALMEAEGARLAQDPRQLALPAVR